VPCPALPRTGHTAWWLCRVGFGVSPGSSMVGSLVAVAVPSGVTNFYKPTAYARPSVVSNMEVMPPSSHNATTVVFGDPANCLLRVCVGRSSSGTELARPWPWAWMAQAPDTRHSLSLLGVPHVAV